VDRLDYLEWLGVDGIWLNPIHPSPNVDWGFDVSDYYGVHPDLGTLEDLDALVAEAGRRGIHVLLDLVPNHTSDRHPWFVERPDFYVWSDHIPNNWLASFGGGPAWSFDSKRHRYYLHNFAAQQPDLDWWNVEVRAEFEGILRFWFDRGVAGFRIDVAHALVKDRELRDNPPADESDAPHVQRLGLKEVYSMNRPETHEILRGWRRLAREYDPERVLLGEVYVLDLAQWARYFGDGDDELNLAFDFPLVHSRLDAEAMRRIVEETERVLPPGGWPAWTGSNHDAARLATRWAHGDEGLIRCSLLIVLGLRGTPVLYYGDELGLENGEVPPGRVLDVAEPARDPGRTPMPWRDGDGGWRDPWLPLSDTNRNVESQREDPESTLTFARDLIALRRELPDLRTGGYASLPSPSGTWAWRRGERSIVAVNLGEREEVVAASGEIVLATRRGREGERVGSELRLAPGEGAVLTTIGP
jgi:alpha-glucosidase